MTPASSELVSSPSLPVDKSHLYMCLSKEHRVSRSFRATWFLSSLDQLIPEELFVKSAGDGDNASPDLRVLSMSGPPLVSPHTQMFFVCQQYSLVFVLDLSDNMRTVSNHTHLVKSDSALSALYATITLLTRQFHAPDNSVSLEPDLCVTVLAYCGNSARKVIQVILQGVYVNKSNCSVILEQIKTSTTNLEVSLATERHSNAECDVNEHGEQANNPSSPGVGDHGLEGMVKAGTLAIQLLPRCALKGLILLTDGISGFSSPLSMHNTVNNMRGANISCWVVHVGGGPHPMDALGLIPDIETLLFMTQACNGCVMDTDKIHSALSKPDDSENSPNIVQRAILFWTFQQGALEERVRGVTCEGWRGWEDPFAPIIDRVFTRSTISAPLLCLVGCKIREGFFLKHVQIKESSLDVCLFYPWQPSVNIYYTITAPWPMGEECESLQVCTSYDGPYSFIHDIQCELNPPIAFTFRLAAIRKFKQALLKFSSSDALLAHFLTFPTTPTYHTLPQAVTDGMPLFYFPPNQSKPAPSVSLTSSGGKSISSLVNFWRPLCTIDTSQWFRWFHSDKVVLVLRQDSTLPVHLLSPSPSGRYATIQCRLSASHLYNFLKSWSTLALLENHSYIRFLPSEETPKYFCLVRVAHVLPCVVLHVGHIQGTPHSLQSMTVTSLVAALKELTFAPSERSLGVRKRSSAVVKPKSSATLIDKQLQRVMIRYDTSVSSSSGTSLSVLAQTESSGERLVQMDYLSCTRWIWFVSHPTPTLLSALLRHRLKEGFLLSGSRNGVVSLIAQLTVEQPASSGKQHLLLQYVIFPFSEHPATELWVEPQYGTVCATPPGLSYLMGNTHADIANKIHNVDKQLVTSVSTFLHLKHRCQGRPSSGVLSGHPLSQSCDTTCRSCDTITCHMDNKPESLFDSSRAIVLSLTAFTEGTDNKFVDLDLCSTLNSKFWTSFSLWLSELAPTQVPTLTDAPTLLTRITTSQTMSDLTSRCQLTASTATEWKYFVCSHDDCVIQLYLPDMFYSTTDGGYVLPLVILECQLTSLMDPDPAQKEVPSKQPDLHIHCPLSASLVTAKGLGESLESMLSTLNNAHVSSYLAVLHSSLQQGLPISPSDFLTGLLVCTQAKVELDLTPLLAALCSHCSITRGDITTSSPLDTDTLSGLLENVVSRLYWKTFVRPVGEGDHIDESYCLLWREETGQAFNTSLSDCQFLSVSQCSGYYYWFDQSGCGQGGPDHTQPQENKIEPHVTNDVVTTENSNKLVEIDHTSTDVTSDPNEEGAPPECDLSFSSEESMDIDPLLSPLLDDLEESGRGSSRPSHGHAPLFLNINFIVKNKTSGKTLSLSHDIKEGSHNIKNELPLCLNYLLPYLSNKDEYSVAMEMTFLSFTSSTPDKRSEVKEEIEGVPLFDSSPISILPQRHQPTAHSLRNKLEWLVADQLVSVSRKSVPITQSLLQAVVTHIQTTQSDKCYSHRVPLRFVFGYNHSMSHFVQELEALEVPNYLVIKTGDYYFFTLKPHPPSHTHKSLPIDLIEQEEERSKTPPPISVQPKSRVHRRSLSSGYPRGHAPKPPPLPSQPGSSVCSALGSQVSIEDSCSGYEASQSCSMSSLSEVVVEDASNYEDFWMILRPLSDFVEVCFQFRSSRTHADLKLEELNRLCENIEAAISLVCHRTNQWFLLRDMLETRMCSPYLLSVSASEAWVDEVVSKQEGVGPGRAEGREVFRGQEFMCDLQWKRHITPHWRLKAKTAQTALRITRTALDAFSVSNRLDVYVLQDIRSSGEEAIFYLKIDESLCRVEEESGLDESLTTGDYRCETRATVDGVDTLSTVSMQPSISEVIPDLDKKANSASIEVLSNIFHDGSGKPQESLVLQLYGITRPSPDLTERLNHVVQFKLDDAVLDAMCSLYTRNQRLKLYPADVQFLQPSISEPSHILSIPLPVWVENVEALVFYFLQNISSLALRPNYTSADHRDHFQVPLDLQNAYLSETCDLSHEVHQDHLFLYIRPHKKGRGMAVVCVGLVSPEGRVITPIPGTVFPTQHTCPLDIDTSGVEGLKCSITEIQTEVKGHYSLRLHVWEKGNIGLTEFMDKVMTCFKHTLIDYILELYLLVVPVATPLRNGEGRDSQVSPYVLIDFPTGGELSKRESFAQDELETVVEEGAVFTPQSRKVSKDSRRSSGETGSRRGSGEDTRRGSGDKRIAPNRTISAPNSGTPSRRASDDVPTKKMSTDVPNFDHTLEMESITVPSRDPPQRSRTYTEQIIDEIEEAIQPESWVDQEKHRREKEIRDSEKLDAYFGNRGILEDVYLSTIPQHLRAATALKALSVRHYSYTLLGSYSSKVFLSQTLSILNRLSSDLALNAFTTAPSGQLVHFDPQADWTKVEKHVDNKLRESRYILIGRNLSQFEESLNPVSRSTKPWFDQSTKLPLQLFQPLDCRKANKSISVPLQHMPLAAEAFVPRQRLVIVMVTSQKADVWLYNFSEDLSKRFGSRLSLLNEWQSSRAGLVQHLLTQKLGLFQHTQGRDVQQCTKLALKHSASTQEVAHLVNDNTPVVTEAPPIRSRLQRPVVINESPLIDSIYQNTSPHTSPRLTEDPVYNHGKQFREFYTFQKRAFEGQELLGKVFQSWQSRSGLAPVNAKTITTLKLMSRLIHYCSSPLLVGRCLKTADKAFCDEVKEEVLHSYIQYLTSLGFQAIDERSTTKRHSHTNTSPKLYKCLQRSWTGGIMLVELYYQGDKFLVKLYTLESSRLVNQSPLTLESQSHFSQECARYKDFIHVHSFMHDFHLQVLLGILDNSRTPPVTFDLRKYLALCYEKAPPNFVRNLLQRGSLEIATPTVAPKILYQYLLVHCSLFGGKTLELKVGGASSPLADEVGLLIDVCAKSLGPMTSPQLSRLIDETQANYSIRIVSACRLSEDPTPTLKLFFYLLLVHMEDRYPRLTRRSPHLSPTCHALPSGNRDSDSDDEESELNIKVREHRRKMGFGSLSTPSQASKIVLNQSLIDQHMTGVKGHLEDVCHEALCHMRRDSLWKRLLYGKVQHEVTGRTVQSPLDGLSCSEFRELLRLVTIVPLESLDQRLGPLKKQSRKWFKKLLIPLQVRFADNIRMYSTEDDSYNVAVIINPDWADMFILVQVDKESRQLESVYRHQKEGGVPSKERLLTANLEAERQHIETIVNFVCSFLWASILDTSPPQPHLNLL